MRKLYCARWHSWHQLDPMFRRAGQGFVIRRMSLAPAEGEIVITGLYKSTAQHSAVYINFQLESDSNTVPSSGFLEACFIMKRNTGEGVSWRIIFSIEKCGRRKNI